MSIRIFEIACVVLVAVTLAAMAKGRDARSLLGDYVLLALAGWIGEESAITAYRYYSYASAWDARVVDVPILVPAIWPLVILSARDVATGLFPSARGVRHAAIVGAVVVVDASLVEVLAVRAGLWSWAEGGHLGVPVLGILGWGFFAFGADLWLGRDPKGLARAAVIAVAPLVAHGLIVVSWWALLKWALRGALGDASMVALVALGVGLALVVVRTRRAGGAIPFAVAWPRIFAALLFFALLLTTAPSDVRLWIHVACVAIPYVLATRLPTAPQPTR
ncbi:MAG: hypothetical protein U0234_28135 [Sandaracinus sp.]